ncbi:cupin domain-containing protein [Poritiphilus flavus]|uniref:Cupin domain-containing protein n=1 Tax=Poritiphilus flavus TaxID=2697053 RepID=A0A6L9E9A0_9FLAO|nr:cupin domain-containing protein [Poritiphilus flavus]NAS11213.1 cupin domain-containing protein [Poritiphilus flavus]
MKVSKAEALSRLADSGKLFQEIFKHGSLYVEVYKPEKVDLQQPHTRDEIYVVISGTGEFLMDTERTAFAPGDFLFVPAGVVHRFENFSDDFVTWVFFYGPEGGEKP